jgi:hypothetical protein
MAAPLYGQPKATPNAVPGARLTAVPTAQDMGAGVGDVIARVGFYAQEQANQMRVEDATNKVRQAELELTFGKNGDNSGYTAAKGGNALERESGKPLSVEYLDTFDKRVEDIGKDLANPAQRQLFQRHANVIRGGFNEALARYEATQVQHHFRQITDGTMATEQNNAALRYNDDEAVFLSRARYGQAVEQRADLEGLTGPARDAFVTGKVSDFHKSVIASALSGDQVGRARKYLDDNQKEIDAGDKIAIETKLREVTKRIEDETWDAVGHGIQQSENRVFSDPTKYQTERENQVALINGLSDVTEKHRIKMRNELDTRLSTARILGLAEQDPSGTAAMLRGKVSETPTAPGNQPDVISKLVGAIRKAEGSGSGAVSPQGATGSMQIMPATFKQYALPGESYSNEGDRVNAAIRKIRDDFQYYGGDVAKTAAAYIGGRGAVLPDGTIRSDVKDALGTTPAAYAQRVLQSVGMVTPRDDALRGELGVLRDSKGNANTEISITVTDPRLNGGKPTNIPTLVRGQVDVPALQESMQPTRQQEEIAIQRALERQKSGATLPSYSSIQEAERAARSRPVDEKMKPYGSGEVVQKTGDPFVDEMPLALRIRLLRQVETQVHQQQALEKHQVTAKIQDFEAMAKTGSELSMSVVPQESELKRAYGELDGSRLYQTHIVPLIQLNSSIKEVGRMTQAQLETLRAAKPAEGEGFAQRQQNYEILTRAN